MTRANVAVNRKGNASPQAKRAIFLLPPGMGARQLDLSATN